MARELDFGTPEGLNHMLLVLQLGVDGHGQLVNMNYGHCALGSFQRRPLNPPKPRMGTAWRRQRHRDRLERVIFKVP